MGTVDAERTFSDHVLRALRGAKIHAEIQLFYHIKMLRLIQSPRVVCSSKDACYLCGFFLTTSTKLHSPKCHGRLYPGWRLPVLSAQDETLRRFNHHLEEAACNSVKNLLRMQKKFSLPDPRESTILTIRRSVSTLAPLPIRPETVDAATDNDNMSPEIIVSEDAKQSTVALSDSRLQVAEDIPERSVTCQDGNTTMQSNAPQTIHDQSQALLPSGNHGETRQKHDLKRNNTITVCVASNDVSCIIVGPLRLYVEYSASHNGSAGNVRKDLKLDAEWITDINDQSTNDHSESSLIDIEKSSYTASLPLDNLDQLDIKYGKHVLRVRLHP
ncbi:uncharacterized protein FTOL_13089 [Fusarium torulosum]|uniref:Uncharacterized protein n=1 Tax=Fusarium torulosum TaxID=33205 RepID=A0AAE8MNQ2_9HYPO|nr:uncharacterized protein FTOL_13089 [Fusarium torulosum]